MEASYEAQEKLGIEFEIGRDAEKNMTANYKKTVKKIFMQKLEKYAEIVGKQLYDRYCFQCTAVAKQFPLLMSGLWLGSEKLKPFDKVELVLKHGTLCIGFIGLAECLIALTGMHHGESQQAQELGLEIINDLQEISEQFSEKYNLNYEVFATPSRRIEESFLKKDQMQFGIIPGVTDKKEYTNSNFIPIAYDLSIEEKAKIESAYHELTKGGNLFCVKLEEAEAEKPENIEKIVDLMDKYNLGYASIQIKKARCLRCGYEENDIKIKNCQNCGSEKIEIV